MRYACAKLLKLLKQQQKHLKIGSCTSWLRINTTGSSVDFRRDKKAYKRGLSWHPGDPLHPGDALEAGHAGVWRLSGPLLLPFPPPGLLTPLLAAATAAHGTATPHAASTPDRSAPRPSPAFEAAIAWRRPSRWSAQNQHSCHQPQTDPPWLWQASVPNRAPNFMRL